MAFFAEEEEAASLWHLNSLMRGGVSCRLASLPLEVLWPTFRATVAKHSETRES